MTEVKLKSRICACIISLAMTLALVPAVALTCAQDALAATTPAAGPATSVTLPSSYSNENVATITFTNTKTVPENAIDSCDASKAGDSSVMCWLIDNGKTDEGNNTLYDVYYGADGVYPSFPEDSDCLFSDMYNMTEIINLDKVSTKNVTSMEDMFNCCYKLESLNLSNFDTSAVTSMYEMFNECYSLESLDLKSFNTSNVTDMYSMFYECMKLQTLNVASFNTSKVTDMSYMFDECYKLKSINLSNFNTSNVTYMENIFSSCKSLETINLANFNTSKVINMESMFAYCRSITKLDLRSFNTSTVTAMDSMFEGCYSLKTVNVSSFKTSTVTGMDSMFEDCYSLETVDVSSFNTSNVTDMSDMFENCYSLKSLNLSNFNTSNVTDMDDMFNDCSSLKSLNLSNFNTSKVADMNHMFYDCTGLKSIDLSNFKGDKVEDTSSMFDGCTNLIYINLSHFNTPVLEDAGNMFYCCYSLKSINIASLDSSLLDDCDYMFDSCVKLEAIYASNNFKLSSDCSRDDIFCDVLKIKGEKGTTYDYDYESDRAVAKVDGGQADPGYFRLAKPETLTLAKSKYAYSGKAITPKLIVKCGAFVLKQGVDYKVVYSGKVANVGTYKITITGIGVYAPVSLSKTFTVDPKAVTLKKAAGAKKALNIKWAKSTKANASGYQIQIATNKKFSKGKKLVAVKKYKLGSKKISNLKAGKKYYVKVRAYKTVSGKKYYSSWSKVKTCKTK